MTTLQKIIKYLAIAFAICLIVSIIGGAASVFGFFGGFFSGNAVVEDVKDYSVSSDAKSLKIEIGAADLSIKQADEFRVESNLKNLRVDNNNGVLTIENGKKFSGTYKGAVLTLYIPANTVFEEVKVSTGAGELTIDSLSAGTVDFDFGAGEVTIGTLIAASAANIDGGAGEITVSNGALRNLDVDMGVGELNLTSALTGNCEFDLGVGESNITVIGNKDDYSLDIEKGIGNITVDGTGVSNIKSSGNGLYSIEVSGGVGAINLKFNDTAAE